METTRLSSKGQVIIPKALRDMYHWEPGDKFLVTDTGHGLLLTPIRPFPTTSLDEVVGMLNYSGPPITVEEMDVAIEQAIREKFSDRS
jgi:AbrB family looped-hinge helix DNA binding protein